MKILVTGAKGFVGKNLVETLKNMRDGKDKFHTLKDGSAEDICICEFGKEDTMEKLQEYCKDCDFVFHFAGVNRPEDPAKFFLVNTELTKDLLSLLEKHGNTCPVVYASSVQAAGVGRFEGSKYGQSKLAGEEAVFAHEENTGAKAIVYRFTNLFGKWCLPHYNSVVATFCSLIAKDEPIQVNDPLAELELCYIDDLVDEMIEAINGREHRCSFDGVKALPEENGKYAYVPCTYKVTLQEIVALLEQFRSQPQTGLMPEIPEGSFAKKLFSTYLSYLPKEKMCVPLQMKHDARGSFTEVLRTLGCGQISVNISKPGITKGEHWHHSKWEIFIVVAGHGLIQERKLGSDEIIEYEVSGDKLEAIYMLPGYTHNLINLSDTEDMITLIWINEEFDQDRPDTYREFVEQK